MKNGDTNGICALGSKCCKNLSNGCGEQNNEDEDLYDVNEFLPYDPSQEPIFPPELKVSLFYILIQPSNESVSQMLC